MKEQKCGLVLMSGGLDSLLAAAIVADQEVEVSGLHFSTAFSSEESEENQLKAAGETLDLDITFRELTDSLLPAVKEPEHGYGSAMNPCLDCRLMMFRKARDLMEERDRDFLVTGEVPGQRPMTQRSADQFRFFEKRSGLEGLVIRPLCAKLLPPSIPEKKGWVDREEFYEINGRSRQLQLELADKYDLSHYSQPAGGCLLTEKQFSHRLKELFERTGRKKTSKQDIQLLRYGRHFRLPEGSKAVVGRDEEENQKLEGFTDDLWNITITSLPSPLTILTDNPTPNDRHLAAQITARYTNADVNSIQQARIEKGQKSFQKVVSPLKADDPLLDELIILAD